MLDLRGCNGGVEGGGAAVELVVSGPGLLLLDALEGLEVLVELLEVEAGLKDGGRKSEGLHKQLEEEEVHKGQLQRWRKKKKLDLKKNPQRGRREEGRGRAKGRSN